eukprot:CAMPEP_0115062310 /NCGR_PEP_ID=MMETSP0227-20121206/8472_1 /TAXON_ID=89957 /ORGANISM="Polarella glacialis, Strain CCMP 1383" /LENGTH=67 /DNA_ID=CAMNT_0002447669 /DNA_START=800 /DNA_END=1003 /DNA_ORIENTATION=-
MAKSGHRQPQHAISLHSCQTLAWQQKWLSLQLDVTYLQTVPQQIPVNAALPIGNGCFLVRHLSSGRQ